jgi:hypothetical protein
LIMRSSVLGIMCWEAGSLMDMTDSRAHSPHGSYFTGLRHGLVTLNARFAVVSSTLNGPALSCICVMSPTLGCFRYLPVSRIEYMAS